MVALEKKDDAAPVCPYCKMELAVLWFQELRGLLGRRYVYFCSHCRSCLGVSHRKGFFMG